MKKHISLFCYIGIILLTTACNDDETGMRVPDLPGVVIRLEPSGMTAVETRSAPDYMGEPDGKVEHVTVYAFDAETGSLLLPPYEQELDYPDNEIRMLLPSDKTIDLHAVCNLQEEITIDSRSDLETALLEVEKPDEVFKGKFVMHGHKPDVTITDRNNAVTIPVDRVGSRIKFDIQFLPDISDDEFFLTQIKAFNLPRKSYLVLRNKEGDVFQPNVGDAVHVAGAAELNKEDSLQLRQANYFDDILLPFETEDGHYKTEFCQFENRRGGLDNSKDWFDRIPDSNPEKELLKQIFKREYGDRMFPFASYVVIKGTYETAGDGGGRVTKEASYRIYLGESNDKDFNICRNMGYHYTVTIRACDKVDTRVDEIDLTRPSITPMFDTPLDAHCNSVPCLMYSSGDWELYVENPELTPWLEISFSENYCPQVAGRPLTDKCATTRLTGTGRKLGYFYIHTDEYVPHLDRSGAQNDHYEVSQALREGTIVLHKKAANGAPAEEERIVITQRPAQIVTLERSEGDYHRFYVECLLEKKNLPWGFENCIDPPLMMQTNLGWWDGLANTRNLYQAALDPEEWLAAGQVPYYNRDCKDWKTDPTVQVPQNVALGYAMTKNRDRDGNGRVDYDEIMWYIPSTDEMYAVVKAINDGYLWFENIGDKFWTSQAFGGGSTALGGRSYYIRTNEIYQYDNSDFLRRAWYSFAMRDRRYNVLCCRMAEEAWPGGPDGSVGGNIDVDEKWKEEEEIMPKK